MRNPNYWLLKRRSKPFAERRVVPFRKIPVESTLLLRRSMSNDEVQQETPGTRRSGPVVTALHSRGPSSRDGTQFHAPRRQPLMSIGRTTGGTIGNQIVLPPVQEPPRNIEPVGEAP